MISNKSISRILAVVRKANRSWRVPVVGHYTETPFMVLISTILSLRTQDRTTDAAGRRLFGLARTPRTMTKLSHNEIQQAIYPVCFYRNKAKAIKKICGILLDKYDGHVPDEMDALLALPGVGRKTANLVITLGFRKPGICVDTHVHRISNRWGYVKTKTPDETEMVLRKRLPPKHWMEYNDLLVTYGQNLCQPVSPHCSRCAIQPDCPRLGVKHFR